MFARPIRIMLLHGTLALMLTGCGVSAASTSPQTDSAAAEAAFQVVATAEPTATVQPTPEARRISASGQIVAAREADLPFQVSGTVAEVLVREGQQVSAGQALARLDTAELQLRVNQAEASLSQAQASYEQLLEGATDAEITAAQAQVAQAAASYQQTRGSVTQADIAAAERGLEQARAALAEVEGGPKQVDVQSTQAQLDQVLANRETQRDSLSAAKTNAQLALEQAANQLRDAQDAYEEIYWDNRDLAEKIDDLPEEARNAEEQAQRAVQNAELSLEQARVSLENAQQAEVDGLAAADAQVAQAQAALDKLLAAADADDLAAARASVASAQASLDKLLGEQRAGSLAAAQAGITSAQANLNKLLEDPSTATLAGSLAGVQNAEVSLEQAQLNLERATLLAPFAGLIAIINVDPGETTSNGAAMRLVDTSALHVEVQISDADIALLREGMAAEVFVDALPGEAFNGTVRYIAPTATVEGTIRTYEVQIDLDEQAGLRAGMQVQVTITIEGNAAGG